MRAILFGGTTEGKELAVRIAEAGIETCVSVASEAGVKSMPTDVPGMWVIVGAIPAGRKVELFREFDVVVDATHPFAESISPHIKAAAEEAERPLLRVVREESDVEGCILVESLEEAIANLDDDDIVLSTTGSKQVSQYRVLEGFERRVYARVLDDDKSLALCREAGLAEDHILAKRGPFSVEENIDDIEEHGITALVTKDSGKIGGFPQKVDACRATDIKCIVIKRPVENGITPDEAFEQIMQMRS